LAIVPDHAILVRLDEEAKGLVSPRFHLLHPGKVLRRAFGENRPGDLSVMLGMAGLLITNRAKAKTG